MAKSSVKDANDEITAHKICTFLQTNNISNEIFLEILSEIKDKHGYKRLKQMVMDLISTHKNVLHNPATSRANRAAIINEVCMIAFTIDTIFPSVLRMKVQQEFPKLINDILYELKDEKKIDNFVPFTKTQSSASGAVESSTKTSLANISSPDSDSSKMSYEEITIDSALRCITSSLNPDAVKNKFSNDCCKTSFQTVQGARKAYRNVAKKRVTRLVESFKPNCNNGDLNYSDKSMKFQCMTQEDHAEQHRTNNTVGNEIGCAIVKSSSIDLQNKKKKKKGLKKEISKSSQVQHFPKISKKTAERLKKKKRLLLKQQNQIKTLKSIVEKNEVSYDNPVFTFFKSVAQTVTQFPPNLIAETRIQMCRIVADMEAKVVCKAASNQTLSPSTNISVKSPTNKGNMPVKRKSKIKKMPKTDVESVSKDSTVVEALQSIPKDVKEAKVIKNFKKPDKKSKDTKKVDEDESDILSLLSVSSVHTSELSSFDDAISLSSDDEEKGKKKIKLEDLKEIYQNDRISAWCAENFQGSKSRRSSLGTEADDPKVTESIEPKTKVSTITEVEKEPSKEVTKVITPESPPATASTFWTSTPQKVLPPRIRKPNSKYISDTVLNPITAKQHKREIDADLRTITAISPLLTPQKRKRIKSGSSNEDQQTDLPVRNQQVTSSEKNNAVNNVKNANPPSSPNLYKPFTSVLPLTSRRSAAPVTLFSTRGQSLKK